MSDECSSNGSCCASCSAENEGKIDKKKLTILIIGAVILAAGIAAEYLFEINEYIFLAVYAAIYILLGGDVVLTAAKNIMKGRVFDEHFLMAIATLGAFAIGQYAEAVTVMLFYQVGEFLQGLAVGKSKKNIARLMDIRPDYANLQVGGAIKTVSPNTVKVGGVIVVKPGERVPLDGIVIEGESMLDAAALTGESVPRRASVSDTVLSGCVNLNGVLTIEVTQTYGESTASRIIDLVENAAAKKAPTEKFITKLARYYTPVVVILALLIAVIPPLAAGGDWLEWIRRSLIFLVISCPCALVISIPLGFFGGISGAARKGILVKGGNYLEALNNPEIVVFDKTGTLTKGVFNVTGLMPAEGFTETELLETAACAEAFSNHPIAQSIRRRLGDNGATYDKSSLSDYDETAGYGVSVKVSGTMVLAGNRKLMDKMGVSFEEAPGTGTKVYVAADGKYMGCIVISDEVKPDSRTAIAELKALGVRKTIMLTGDDPKIAQAVAAELGIDEVFGGLLPQEKVEKVEAMKEQQSRKGKSKGVDKSTSKSANKGKLVFVGDGINDAPVLASADVGVAMGALGSDAAIEAADVVLMTDQPHKLAEAVRVARFTRVIVWQNIIFALGVKGIFLALGAVGIASMWEAVFADVGVALLAVLNAVRVMRK